MIRYAPLFTVGVVHDYFLNRDVVVHEALRKDEQDRIRERYLLSDFLDIVPTEGTVARLSGQQMIFKNTPTGFLVAVKTDSSVVDLRPLVPLPQDMRLTFSVRTSDARFFNYTQASVSLDGLYRFSNSSGNEVAGQLLLTRPIPGYDAARVYEAGSIYAVSTAGVIGLFRAVRDTGPAGAPISTDWVRIPMDTWDAAITYLRDSIVLLGNRVFRALVDEPGSDLTNVGEWEMVSSLANQYVSPADQLSLRSGVFGLDVSSAALARATVRVFRLGEVDVIAERHYSVTSGTLGIVQVDGRSLVEGAYQLEVLDDALDPVPSLSLAFYLDARAAREGWLGVIEISAGSAGFALLDGSGALQSPHYILRFLNRSTRWRYIFPQAQSVGAGAEVAAEADDPRVLVTDEPRPLTYFGSAVRLQADSASTPGASEQVLLPLPEPHRIRRHNQQWYSETHMSNLSL